MKRIRVISCLVILLFAYNLPIRSIDKTKNLEVLADSARHLLGKSGFVPVNTAWMQLARDLNDSIQMEAAYSELFDHYYRLGEVDSLRIVGYELMDWYTRRNKKDERYQLWRHYIQRLTENEKQDEVLVIWSGYHLQS